MNTISEYNIKFDDNNWFSLYFSFMKGNIYLIGSSVYVGATTTIVMSSNFGVGSENQIKVLKSKEISKMEIFVRQ